MCKLTIIIPFLNEGAEVRNTIESILHTVENGINIILINDASDDSYDYEQVAKDYHISYLKNETRLGVAASRDIGIAYCTTPYFLLLDAHMRFYDHNWKETIIHELEQDDRVVLCCQTKVLHKIDGVISEAENQKQMFGAYIDLSCCRNILNPEWITNENNPNSATEDIPCILGAAYAASKRYWQYLKGLYGLRSYGSDETYISIKVWLEGGKCKLLKNITTGHIYRTQFPYNIEKADVIFNRLFIASLFLPDKYCFKIFECLKKHYNLLYIDAYQLWTSKELEIDTLKGDYQKIFTKNVDFILDQNKIQKRKISDEKDILLLNELAYHLILHLSFLPNIGFLEGKMGLVIFLSHYARFSGQSFCDELAGKLLNSICEEINTDVPVNFINGICGIGWAIDYLIRHKFMEGNTTFILENFDKKVMERDPQRITDWSFRTGLGGILHYVVCRMHFSYENKQDIPFDQGYLLDLKNIVQKMLINEDFTDSVAIALQYQKCFRSEDWGIEAWEIEDLVNLQSINDDKYTEMKYGVDGGCLGLGIRIMNNRTLKFI